MRGITPRVIAQVCKGRFIGSADVLDKEIAFVTRDSREAGEGCLFAAIPGERVDGHDFLDMCREKGAVCAICQRDVENTSLPYVLVEDTQTALGALSAHYRRQFDIPVIGITGSVGKTSAKEMVSAVLSRRFNTLKTQGNYNNELGVPLTLFGLTDAHEAAVVEMGISDFGEMERLTAMVQPTAAVITTVGYSHLERLGDLDGVLRAKTAITDGMVTGGQLFVNGDDEKLRGYVAYSNKLCYGIEPDNDLWAENIRALGLEGMEFDIVSTTRRIPVKINAFGDHLVYAALAAASVGIYLGLTDTEIAAGIADYQVVGRRSRAVSSDKLIVIDDCYNSNPNSAISALRSLSLVEGRKVAILGDMLELGRNSAALHVSVGDFAGGVADLVVTQGEMSRNMHEGAAKKTKAVHFDEKPDLIASLKELILPGDVVLVKASRGMRFEDVSEALMKL